jgi:hypothetical protein
MHERLIDYINGHDGVTWMTFDEIAHDFSRRQPAPSKRAQAAERVFLGSAGIVEQ